MLTSTQQVMNDLLPAGEHVTPKDIAAATGFSPKTITNAIAEYKIAGFSLNASAAKGKEIRMTTRIPRFAATAYMAKIFTADVEVLRDEICNSLRKFDKASVAQIHAAAARELARR